MTKTSLRAGLTAALVAAALVAAPSAQAWPIFLPKHPIVKIPIVKPVPKPPHHHWGPGMGIGLGLGLLGAAAASAAYANNGYCHTERRYNEYGEYIGRVRVCE
jgi:hypothetical protein